MFGRKKSSPIDRRLQELQREMAKLNTEINSLARYGKAKGDVSGMAADNVPVAGAESGKASEAGPLAPSSPMGATSQIAGAGDLFSQEMASGKPDSAFAADAARGGTKDMPLFERRDSIVTSGREKFANYFMAGHFTNLRPLRQEKRIVRNKAIVMVVLVVLALIWLLFFLHSQ